MSRRAGKAASRRARQRKVQRPAGASAPPVSAPGAAPTVEAVAAVEPSPASRPASRAGTSTVGSQLTATERSEYHYVERDLRDIGILTVVMAALLLLAWFVFGALNLTG